MSKKLTIIGASGHGKVIADIALLNGYLDIIFLDDNTSIKECAGFPVVDKIENAANYSNRDFIVAIGNNSIRRKIQKGLKNLRVTTLIHPTAVISRRVTIGSGTVVMANTVINSDVKIGGGCIVNTSSSIDHDCTISDYCHISVGAHLAGNVSIGERSWISIGASIINNVSICNDVLVGAGAIVISDIFCKGVYVGVPAKNLKG
ncbi:acetyltransferase [Streptococcus sp. E24BD]|uniref:acetyltransferase n=1 Tax=Streptococcus sp. E24BD TaxID=3278715 RepID=UPI00359D2AD2